MTRFVIFIFAVSFLFTGAITAQEQKTPAKSDTTKPNRQPSAQSDNGPATDGKAKKAEAQKQKKKSKTPEEGAARNEVLYQFVDQHHPSLRRLLNLLERKHPDQFRKAMRTLSTQYDRLAKTREKDPERYEIALELWKIRSRIEYVSAQLTVENTEEIEQSLRSLLSREWDHVVQMRQLEIRRTEARLEKMNKDLAEQKQTQQEILDGRFERAIAKAQKRSSSLASKKKKKKSTQVEAGSDPSVSEKKKGSVDQP